MIGNIVEKIGHKRVQVCFCLLQTDAHKKINNSTKGNVWYEKYNTFSQLNKNCILYDMAGGFYMYLPTCLKIHSIGHWLLFVSKHF